MRPTTAILFALLLALPTPLLSQAPTYRGRTVAQWSDDLSHPNSVIRVEAAKMLGRLGRHANQAVDPLIAALHDRNLDVRLYAATALGRIKHRPEPCLVALTKLLEDQNEHVRFAAEWSLARIAQDVSTAQHAADEAEKLDQLLAAAESSLGNLVRNTKHLQQIADARKKLTTIDEAVVETRPPAPAPIVDESVSLLSDLRGDDKIAQLRAIGALRRLGRADALLVAWRELDEDEFLHWQLTDALANIGEPAVTGLVRALRDDDELVAMDAARCLERMGPIAIRSLPELLAIIEDEDASSELRWGAISTIERFGPAAHDAVETLKSLLKEGQPETLAQASMRALAAIGPSANAAVPDLLTILRSEDQPELSRMAAAEALPYIDASSAEILETMIALVNENDSPYFVARLAESLGRFGPAASPAVPRLVQVLDDTSDFERESIIRALGEIGLAARQAAPRLITCLTDVEEFETVQVAAARSLGNLGQDAVSSLAQQLDHSNPRVRATIARALIEIGAKAAGAVEPLELRLVDNDEDLEVRSLAAVALGHIGTKAKSALPTLTRLLGDVRQAIYLRAMAAVAIGQIDPTQSPTLIAAMNDANAEIRVAAAYSLQRLPTPHPDALPTLVRALDHIETRGMAMQALSEFKHDSRPLLTDVMNDVSQDEQTRIACLTLISEDGIGATNQLLRALNDDTLAESAYWSLRDLGNDSIPMLVAAAENDDEFTAETREVVLELVNELYDGIGGGDGDNTWTNGHALVDGPLSSHRPAARMATAAPEIEEWIEEPVGAEPLEMAEPEEIMPPPPEPAAMLADRSSDFEPSPATVATQPNAPNPGFKTVKVFYGTNRNSDRNGAIGGGMHLPWYVWIVIAAAIGGMMVFVVKQFRRGERARAIAGIAGFILLCLAVEAAVRRIQQLDQALNKSGDTYGVQYTNQVKMGYCDVTIPDIHQEGQLERPSILRLQIVEDPEKHIIVKRVQQLEPDAFFTDLQSELGQRGNSVLVFVHGYNVSFESAARRTAQMSHDLKFAGAPVFYSWPSQANWRKYRVDEKNVELSINQLKTFLLEITKRSGADTINLIAHSMGNRALTSALKEIEVSATQKDKMFNQVILAAPDIDADVFRERIAPAIVSKARHITLYASSKDLALIASREFNSGDPRAGDAGADLVLVQGIDTIDVSLGESSLLGHSYYGDSTSVLRDIELLLRDQPASERQFLEPFPHREPTHWLFQPAAMARRNDATEDWR